MLGSYLACHNMDFCWILKFGLLVMLQVLPSVVVTTVVTIIANFFWKDVVAKYSFCLR
jgi:hypothetical protein